MPPNEENNNLSPSELITSIYLKNDNIISNNNNINNNNYLPPQKNINQYQPFSTMRTDDMTNNAFVGSINKSPNDLSNNQYSPNKYNFNTNQALIGSSSDYKYKPYLNNNYKYNSTSLNYTYNNCEYRKYFCPCCCPIPNPH